MQEKRCRLTAVDGRTRAHTSTLQIPKTTVDLGGDTWRGATRRAVGANIDDFVGTRCAPELAAASIDIASEVLREASACGRRSCTWVGCAAPATTRRRCERAPA